MSTRRRFLALFGTGIIAVLVAVGANVLGVIWDGDEFCHHYARVSRAGTRESPPEDAEAVRFSDLEAPATQVVQSVLNDGKYLTCNPTSDPALTAFIEQTTMDGDQLAMVVERDSRYHWFVYQIEDMVHGEYPD